MSETSLALATTVDNEEAPGAVIISIDGLLVSVGEYRQFTVPDLLPCERFRVMRVSATSFSILFGDSDISSGRTYEVLCSTVRTTIVAHLLLKESGIRPYSLSAGYRIVPLRGGRMLVLYRSSTAALSYFVKEFTEEVAVHGDGIIGVAKEPGTGGDTISVFIAK